ncbi:VOC family protein [Jatrophihabitans endophyticus]|uniref:VOC family protein n=1 Tax=Jatrophihabitans endophyticus TaxID=1206085 RepID=UPI001A10A444|nr:VOC family protein [Jatrophihabitans endophyticus]MBE7188781.1 VOC family protein [Jatrophihabitans endophyticus]
MTGSARLRQVVLDTTDVRRLAEFYRGVLGWDYRPGDEPPADLDWLVLRNPDGGVSLAFQQTDALPETTWPDADVPQQLHLDLSVASPAELTAEHDRVVGLGARVRLDRFDDPDEPLYVFADPAGHLFCIFSTAEDQDA